MLFVSAYRGLPFFAREELNLEYASLNILQTRKRFKLNVPKNRRFNISKYSTRTDVPLRYIFSFYIIFTRQFIVDQKRLESFVGVS
jgi:hypothetical protein